MSDVKILDKNKPFFYLTITLGLMVSIILLFYFLGIRLNQHSSFFLQNFYFFVPFIAVFIIKKIIYKEKLFEPHYYNFKFNANFLIVIYFLLGLELLVFLVDILLPFLYFSNDQGVLLEKYARIFTPKQFSVLVKFVTDFNIQFFWILNLFIGIIVGMTSGAFFVYFQEIGWRGFLLDCYRIMGFWKSSFYTGFWCGVFYIPLIFIGYSYFKNIYLTIFFVLAWNILMSPILVLIRNVSNSVIYPSIFLGVLNSTYVLSTFFVVGADEYIISFKGFVGIFVLGLVDLFLYFYLKNRPVELKSKRSI